MFLYICLFDQMNFVLLAGQGCLNPVIGSVYSLKLTGSCYEMIRSVRQLKTIKMFLRVAVLVLAYTIFF